MRLKIAVVFEVLGMLRMAERHAVAAVAAARSEVQTGLRMSRRTGSDGTADWGGRTSTHFTNLLAQGGGKMRSRCGLAMNGRRR